LASVAATRRCIRALNARKCERSADGGIASGSTSPTHHRFAVLFQAPLQFLEAPEHWFARLAAVVRQLVGALDRYQNFHQEDVFAGSVVGFNVSCKARLNVSLLVPRSGTRKGVVRQSSRRLPEFSRLLTALISALHKAKFLTASR